MKRKVFNLCILLTLLMLGVTEVQAANPVIKVEDAKLKKEEFTKQINKDFPISSDGTVKLINKYGDINLKTWNQNKVSIKITIKVKAKSEDAAKEVFDRINFDFANSDDFVKAETQIASQSKKGWWSGWSNDRSEFKINYEVNMPEGGSLDVYNKYGDVFAAAIKGNGKAEVDYGNIRMDGVGGNLEINLGYSNGTIYSCKDANAYVKYGKLKFKKVEDLDMESKYSKVYIDEANKLRTMSKYDTYEIGKVESIRSEGKYDNYRIDATNSLDITTRYSDIRVDNLKDRVIAVMDYGSLRVEEMGRDFSEVNLEGKYADFRVRLHESAVFSMDMYGENASFSYPSGMEINYEKQKHSEHEVRGYKGSKSGGGKVYARVRYGGVRLK